MYTIHSYNSTDFFICVVVLSILVYRNLYVYVDTLGWLSYRYMYISVVTEFKLVRMTENSYCICCGLFRWQNLPQS